MRSIIRIQILALLVGLALAACTRSPATTAPASADTTEAAQTCPPGQRLFFNCRGDLVCAPRPFECAPPVAPEPGISTPDTVAATCTPPQRSCVRCNGSGTFCSIRCPECAPQDLAPKADEPATIAQLVPVGENCGGTICAAGTHCCNPTCGVCTPKGVNCTQQTCN